MLKDIQDRLNKPTPPKYRKIGKGIAGLGATLQVTIAALQAGDMLTITKKEYVWIVIGIAILGWVGQFITDLYTDDEVITMLQDRTDGQV